MKNSNEQEFKIPKVELSLSLPNYVSLRSPSTHYSFFKNVKTF